MVIPTDGQVIWLFFCMVEGNTTDFEDWWLDLFVNPETVAQESIADDFTLATFGGYSSYSLTRASFERTAWTGGTQSITERAGYPSWECTGVPNQTVYGWIMRGKTTNALYAGQNFVTPRLMSLGAIMALNPFQFRMQTLH